MTTHAYLLQVLEVNNDLGGLAVGDLAQDPDVLGGPLLVHVQLVQVIQLVVGLVLRSSIVVARDRAVVLPALRDKLG
jgi:hypothetical protein